MQDKRPTENRNHAQKDFLNLCIRDKLTVTIFLTNGVRLQGIIKKHDCFVIYLSCEKQKTKQIIYKSAIATVSVFYEKE
jgi:host factor-I protein